MRQPVEGETTAEWTNLLGEFDADVAGSEMDTAIRRTLTQLFDPNTMFEIGRLARRSQRPDDPAAAMDSQWVGPKSGDGVIAGWGTIAGVPVFFAADDAAVDDWNRGPIGLAKSRRVRGHAERHRQTLLTWYGSPSAEVDNLEPWPQSLGSSGGERELAWSHDTRHLVPHISVVHRPLAGMAAVEAVSAHVVVLASPDVTLTFGDDVVSSDQLIRNGFVDYIASDLDHAAAVIRMLLETAAGPTVPVVSASVAPRASYAWADIHVSQAVSRIIDADREFPLKPMFAMGVRASLARVEGQAIGIVGLAGPIDDNECRKYAHAIRVYECLGLPAVHVLSDVVVPATDAGAELVHTIARSGGGRIVVNMGAARTSGGTGVFTSIGPQGSGCDERVAAHLLRKAVSDAVRRWLFSMDKH